MLVRRQEHKFLGADDARTAQHLLHRSRRTRGRLVGCRGGLCCRQVGRQQSPEKARGGGDQNHHQFAIFTHGVSSRRSQLVSYLPVQEAFEQSLDATRPWRPQGEGSAAAVAPRAETA